MNLNSLPYDIVLAISSHLQLHDALNLTMTCRRIWEVSNSELAYWATALLKTPTPLPLPPFEVVWDLSPAQLRGIASRLVAQESNLNRDEPVLRKAVTYDIEGAVGFQEDFIGIPGCPLLIIGQKVAAYYSSSGSSELSKAASDYSASIDDSDSSELPSGSAERETPPARIMCFDYFRGKSLCSVDCPGRLYKISKPYHQLAKCIVAVQISIGKDME
ncbi:hypothetical protein L218DRAFT_958139 [Marasmius fiardii PR-910]|nr:hypothetical protein L218DRAFT_958139 [Marasmius fiardii PR-910]